MGHLSIFPLTNSVLGSMPQFRTVACELPSTSVPKRLYNLVPKTATDLIPPLPRSELPKLMELKVGQFTHQMINLSDLDVAAPFIRG